MKVRLSSLGLLLILAACGGGGGGDTKPTTGGNGGGSGGTTNPPAVIPGTLVDSVAPATYATNSVDGAAYALLNDVRSKAGFGLLAQNAQLDAAAKNHLAYLFANNVYGSASFYDVDPTTGQLVAHSETAAGTTGFTGALPTDRITYAGYTAADNTETIAYTAPTEFAGACVDSLLTTVYHRSALLRGYTDVGVAYQGTAATANAAAGGLCQVTMAAKTTRQHMASDKFAVYPYADQKDVSTGFPEEAPKPLPDYPGYKGQPVSVNFGSTAYTITAFTLVDNKGATIPAVLLAGDKNVSQVTGTRQDGRLDATEVYLVPTQRLTCDTTYTVTLTGTFNSAALNKTWQFSTGPQYNKDTYKQGDHVCFDANSVF